jgi:putative membrane protein
VAGLSLASAGFAADTASALSSDDQNFVKMAAQHGMKEVKVAELGTRKAASPEVKAFAETLVKDHTAANKELTAFASANKVEISAAASPEAAEKVQDLEKEETGQGFDKAFLDGMVASHKKTIEEFEETSKNTQNASLKAWVDKTLPTLKAHHEQAKALEAKQ